jgi:branched-chain amino acid transport system ATP-binding protein
MLLDIKNITVHYGKAMAIQDISLGIAEGSIVSIIGANGAGKSTILRAVSGLTPLTSGEIWFSNKRIDSMPITDIVKLGIGHVPEGRKLFPYLSVLDHLKLGATLRQDKAGINKTMEGVFKLFPVLQERLNQKAGTLSGGEQQMLAIGRGLMAKPKLLLMDEPSLGLAPIMVEKVGTVVKDINNSGVTVLLVEQNAALALGVANRGYAIQVGKVIFEGTIEQIKSSDIIRKVYLGG